MQRPTAALRERLLHGGLAAGVFLIDLEQAIARLNAGLRGATSRRY
jgi:hypothetical protein